MQTSTPPLPKSTKMEYLIDRDELLRLHEMKLVDRKFYVYLALKLTFTTVTPNVDIPTFAEQWELTESEVAIALAQLQKKGALQPTSRSVQLELF